MEKKKFFGSCDRNLGFDSFRQGWIQVHIQICLHLYWASFLASPQGRQGSRHCNLALPGKGEPPAEALMGEPRGIFTAGAAARHALISMAVS